ncbi:MULTISPECIES: hypothetical protein [Streptomyces]|uniref:Uncharacterized protein n=1 Tax=Streptomyces sudanensis TaxID=436397 RepID=A0ABY4TGW9_9ACTN|nr:MULTISPECIES: hypothetical protein [Streptomyces]URN16067.1 hypothetical protein MW084_09020 [Streptomyces sudanensis]
MIKMSWALAGEHADAWTGADIQEGTAVLEARVRAVVEASGMTAAATQHWQETFLAPVVNGLRTEGLSALSQGGTWSKAAGPMLVSVSPDRCAA